MLHMSFQLSTLEMGAKNKKKNDHLKTKPQQTLCMQKNNLKNH